MMPTRIVEAIESIFFERTPVGFLDEFKAQWLIEVKKPGWCVHVDVTVELQRKRFDPDRNIHIHVYAHGHLKNRDGDHRRRCFYPAFFGTAKPEQISRRWVESVLPREIETALVAARGFTEADLSTEFQYTESEFFKGMAGYFQSTLEEAL